VPDPIDGYGITCSDTDRALTHGLMVILSSPDSPSVAQLTMLAPRKSRITVTMADGRTSTLAADDDGVVSARLVDADEISVETSSGAQRLGMPVLGPSEPPSRDCGEGHVIDPAGVC
jgi:hypothetical protein